jgi:lysophospholipase L1-like esterase
VKGREQNRWRRVTAIFAVVTGCAVLAAVTVFAPAEWVGKHGAEGEISSDSALRGNAFSLDADRFEPVRILPLGDSITQGDGVHKSYRYNLWIKLVDSGIQFDFVGSVASNWRGNPTWPDYKEHSFDRDHEGHWGWRSDQILDGFYGSKDGKLSEWLKDYTPDIVLMHLGTNDMLERQSVSSTIEDFRQIITQIRAHNPRVTVLLATLIPTGDANVNRNIDDLNDRIEDLGRDMNTKASRIILVDQAKGFSPDTDTNDGLHPNELGEEKMAQRWIEGLETALGNEPRGLTKRIDNAFQ